jgi:hypothetical protein
VSKPDTNADASPTPTPDPSILPTKPAEGVDKPGYDLAPDDPPRPPRIPTPPAKSPTLDAAGLTDDFDEGADFDHDASAPPAAPAKPAAAKQAPADADANAFVRPGLGSAQTIGTLAVAVAVLAIVLAAALGTQPWYKSAVHAAYLTAVQTLAGLVAVVFAARMAEKPLGQPDLALARMLLAVAAARCMLPLTFGVPYTGRFLEALSAFGLYALVTILLFRVNRHHWLIMAGAHAALVLLLWIGSSIEIWASTPEPKPGP